MSALGRKRRQQTFRERPSSAFAALSFSRLNLSILAFKREQISCIGRSPPRFITYDILESVGIEVAFGSIFVARAGLNVRNDMGHFSDVLVTAQFNGEQRVKAFRSLAMPCCFREQPQSCSR